MTLQGSIEAAGNNALETVRALAEVGRNSGGTPAIVEKLGCATAAEAAAVIRSLKLSSTQEKDADAQAEFGIRIDLLLKQVETPNAPKKAQGDTAKNLSQDRTGPPIAVFDDRCYGPPITAEEVGSAYGNGGCAKKNFRNSNTIEAYAGTPFEDRLRNPHYLKLLIGPIENLNFGQFKSYQALLGETKFRDPIKGEIVTLERLLDIHYPRNVELRGALGRVLALAVKIYGVGTVNLHFSEINA